MEQRALFADVPAPPARHAHRGANGQFRVHPGSIPLEAEVARVERVLGVASLFTQLFPNPSEIIRTRSNGQGIRLYTQMLKTDPDMAGLINDLVDDVLHYEATVTAYADGPAYKEHARFAEFAIRRIPGWQQVVRHALQAPARGFAVFEKIYGVVDRGEWRGAVVLDALLDKPQEWFSFDLDRNLRLRTIDNPFPGELVNQDKFLRLTYGSNSNPWGDPALDYCYFPWRLKHHAIENQAIYFEKWAQPTALAEYEWSNVEKVNRANVDKALAVMQSIQTDQSIAVPKGIAVKLLESVRNGTVSYQSYIESLTETQSRFLTGQILTSMGSEGGSHALGKVHEKRAANKVEMYAEFCSEFVDDLIRELVIRNYGPQDGYPDYKILAKSPVSRQAEATLEQQLIANGHEISRSHSAKVFGIVAPTGPDDVLMPAPQVKPGQPLPVPQNLAAPAVELAMPKGHADLMDAARAAGRETQANLKARGAAAARRARPEIRRLVKTLAKAVAKKKKAKDVTRAHVFRAIENFNGQPLADVHAQMLGPMPAHAALAADGGGGHSTAALLALALQVMAIAQRVAEEAQDAPEETTGAEVAESLTDPQGAAVDQAFGNMFEGTHSTNVSSVATAQLRQKLADPKFRQAYPYVMVTATNPDVRLSHKALDGFILSAEEAQYSPFLPPFDFGCDCVATPISAEEAAARGLTGAAPTGTLDSFLQSKGLSPARGGFGYRTPDGQTIQPGAPVGFDPAYRGTDERVQLEALRQKAAELQAQDPEAFAALSVWLRKIFGFDPLLQDSPTAP